MSTERLKKDPQKNTALRKCFQALVDRKQVNINMDILKLMLKYELQVNTDGLEEQLAAVLPLMLIVYIRNWPGWQKSKEYYSGKLNFREWFIKFRQYIIVKLNFVIKNGYKEVMDSIFEDRRTEQKERLASKSLNEKGTQTDYLASKEIAPFCISLECSPTKLSTIFFVEKNDNVIFILHKPLPWEPITIRELLNWPYIGVEFKGANLAFKRLNRSKHSRYLNFISNNVFQEKVHFVEEISVVDPKIPQVSYSLNVLWAYLYQYLEILRNYKLAESNLEVIEILFEEFLKDANEWDFNHTIGTNTFVLFNIGSSFYTRNKKENNQLRKPEVGYSEILIPRMHTQLTNFNCVQDVSTVDVTFCNLNTLKRGLEEGKSTAETIVPVLVFSCLFCNIKCSTHTELMQHLENEHGLESHFICPKCLRSFPVKYLTQNRWAHSCHKNK